MTDRERLIEILRKPIFPHELADPTEAVADYLISNGVAVREKGKWIAYPDCGVTRCPVCDWSIEEAWYSNFCPECGADMRRERKADDRQREVNYIIAYT